MLEEGEGVRVAEHRAEDSGSVRRSFLFGQDPAKGASVDDEPGEKNDGPPEEEEEYANGEADEKGEGGAHPKRV